MSTLIDLLASRFQDALVALYGNDYRDVDPILRPSDHADFQANVAMSMGKKIGQPPRDVATAITQTLDTADLIESLEVAGPGFINIVVTNDALEKLTKVAGHDDRLGIAPIAQPRRVIVDYSHPNVAKEMHVGHLRTTVIGDSINRVMQFLGHDVTAQNHIGDWGTPFGMLIEHLIDLGEDEAAQELSLGDLNKFYQEARKKYEADETFADRSRHRVVLLQSGDAYTVDRWQFLYDESTRYFNTVYELLGVLLTDDDLAGESSYNDDLPVVAQDLEEKGLAVIDDGALCVFPPGFYGPDKKPAPLLIRKTGGGFNYAATDLAAVRHRAIDVKADDVYYVVDARQADHFAKVFTVARMAGWIDDTKRFEHVPFGTVLGNDGKPFKTRDGVSIKLIDLLEEAVTRAAAVIAERNPELSGHQADMTARAVGIGAIKYADLSGDRIKDYVFDFDRMLSFDGNTAPYLQYAHARIYSILRKADVQPQSIDADAIRIITKEERDLALALLALPGVIAEVAEFLQPHRLCTYLFSLASTFTAFYEKCPVLKAETEEIKNSRLALSLVTARALELGLSLLGIDAPTQM